MKKSLIPALAGLIAAGSLAQAQITVDFNNYANNTAYLAQWNPNTGNSSNATFQLSAFPGVGGNGVVTSNQTNTFGASVDVSSQYTAATYNFTNFSKTTVSTLFQWRKDTGSLGPLNAQLGLGTTLNQTFLGNATGDFLTGRLIRVSANSTLQLQTQYLIGSTATTLNGPTVALTTMNGTAENWFKLTFEINRAGSNQVTSVLTLDNYGATGTSLVGNVLTQNITTAYTIGSSLYSDTDTYLGLRSSLGSDFIRFDNISVVPEPATAALLVATAAGGFLYLRGRRRKE